MSTDEIILTVMFFQDDCWVMQSDKTLNSQQTVGPLLYDASQKSLKKHNNHLAGKGVTGPLSPQLTWKMVTVQLEAVQVINSIDWWPCELDWIPPSWHVDVSLDGTHYERALAVDQFQSNQSTGYLISAPCQRGKGDTGLLPLQTNYLRFAFDEMMPQENPHEWAVEVRLQSLPRLNGN